MIKIYYQLTKPGIIYGNAITMIAGFFLASQGHIDWQLLLAALVGLSLIIASGCVFNNIADRDIDNRMERTKNRALVTGAISKQKAFIFGTILGLSGALTLYFTTNPLTLCVALVGLFVYVALYTPLKRLTMHATLVGAVAGAVPPVVGYCAVTNSLDLGAILLFLILVAWQMPHFYSIAIRRRDDYTQARIPVLSVKKGIYVTKINIMIYIMIFIMMLILLNVYGYAGLVYLGVMLLISLYWFLLAVKGLKPAIDDKAWAKKMFLFSLFVLLVFSLMVSINGIIRI